MRVSAIEWALALTVVALAGVAQLQTTYEATGAVLFVMVLLSVALVIVAAVGAKASKAIGRFMLMGATLGFFWVEALGSARKAVPFQVGSGLPVAAGQFDLGLVQKALFFIALFQLMLLAGYSIRPNFAGVFRMFQRRLDQRTPMTGALRYLLAACALIPLLLSFSFDVSAITGALTGGRGTTNPAYQDVGLVNLITFFGLYGASLLLVDALLFRSFSRVQKFIVGAFVTAPFILGGVRHLWLFVAIPVGVVAFRMNSKEITFSRLMKWIVAAVALLVVVQVQLLVRQAGWEHITEVQVTDLTRTDATGQFDALLVAEALVPDRHPYFREPAEPYFLIHWIPRRFWAEKPTMKSWTYYNDQYTGGDVRFNVTPSVIGQFYLNWGIYGVAYVGVFLGFLMVTADRILLRVDPRKQTAVAVAVGSFVAFIVVSFRFYSPVYFTYFAFAFIGMLVITKRHRALVPKTATPGPSSFDSVARV